MEEIELKYVPTSESAKDKQENFIDRRTTCFVCLANICNYSNLQSNYDDQVTQKVSLFRICRYLKINLEEIISKHSSDTLLLPDKFSKLKTSVCRDCHGIFENLSNLLEQLELLQMKVDYALGKFSGVFKAPEKDQPKLYQFHNPSSDTVVGPLIPKNIAENLRTEISKKCEKRLRAVIPKVIIAEVLKKKQMPTCPDNTSPTPSPHVPEPSTTSATNWKCIYCPRFYNQRRNLSRHQHKMHPNKKLIGIPISPVKIPKISASNIRTCKLCRPIQTVAGKRFAGHKIVNHFESYFISHKIPQLTRADFKLYCEHVFKIELLSSTKSLTSGGLTICKCGHCSTPFKKQEAFRSHLLASHKQILSEKLIKLQKSTRIQEIKEITLPKFSFSKNNDFQAFQVNGRHAHSIYYTCNICQPSRIIHQNNKARHLANFHATAIFSASKTRDDMTENEFKIYCEHLFDTEIQSCEKIGEGKRNQKIKCNHCRKILSDSRILRSHLVAEHKEILVKKLVKIQETVDVGEIREHFTRISKRDGNWEGNVKADVKETREKAEMAIGTIANQVVGVSNAEDANFEHTDEFVTKIEVPGILAGGEYFQGAELMDEDVVDSDLLGESQDNENKMGIYSRDPLEI